MKVHLFLVEYLNSVLSCLFEFLIFYADVEI